MVRSLQNTVIMKRLKVKKQFVTSATILGLVLALSAASHVQGQASAGAAKSPTREQLVISTAGARGMIDACEEYAMEHHHNSLSMVVIDWGGNIIEAHAMEGSVPNNTDTALLKAKNALRWRRPQSETNAGLKPDHFGPAQFVPEAFPIPGGLPIVIKGQVIGAMGVSLPAEGEECIKYAMDKVFHGEATDTAREPRAEAPAAAPAK